MKKDSHYTRNKANRKRVFTFGLVMLIVMIITSSISGYLFFSLQKDEEDRLIGTIGTILTESISRISFSGKYHSRLLLEEMHKRLPELAYISVESLDGIVEAHADREKNDTEVSEEEKVYIRKALASRKTVIVEKYYSNEAVKEVLMTYSKGLNPKPAGVVRIGIKVGVARRKQQNNLIINMIIIFLLSSTAVWFMEVLSQRLNKSEKALQETNLRHSAMIANIGDVIGIIDVNGNRIYNSPNVEKWFGWSPEELIGINIWDHVYPDDIDGVKKEFNALIKQDDAIATVKYRKKCKDGSYKWVELTAVNCINNPAIKGILLNYRDITERKISEENLRSSEENLRTTLNSIGDAVIATDADGNIKQMNPIAEELTGWVIKDAVGLPLPVVFKIVNSDTNEACENPAQKVLNTCETVGLPNSTKLLSKNGIEYLIADSAAPIQDTDGKIVGTVLVFRDVTDQVTIESRLRQSEKMDSIGQLAGGVAHDFNNMLAGIMGASEMLALKIGEDKHLNKYISMINEASKRAADLTQKLLDFSRKGKVVSTPIDVHIAIKEASGLLERSIDKKIEIKNVLTADVSTIIGDPAQIQNAILNLGVNARDAMPEGGVLTIATSNVELNQNDCTNLMFIIEPGNYIEIQISDTGMGMDPGTIKHIYEPFFTTKKVGKGTGLGLSSVYGTIKAHHGAIHVCSEQGTGTVFKIYLPVEKHYYSNQKEEKYSIKKGQGTILVVDDESIIRNMAKSMLESLGYKTLIAMDGAEGIEVYRSKRESIDLVLLDMVMPKKDGRETVKELRVLNPDIKIIISSGFSRDKGIGDLISRSANIDFIQKPFQLIELSMKIAAVLGRQK